MGRSIPAAGGRLQHVPEHRGWSDFVGGGSCAGAGFVCIVSVGLAGAIWGRGAKAITEDVFQSLSGFLMSCNLFTEFNQSPDHLVSIPIGFSNEL